MVSFQGTDPSFSIHAQLDINTDHQHGTVTCRCGGSGGNSSCSFGGELKLDLQRSIITEIFCNIKCSIHGIFLNVKKVRLFALVVLYKF